ncbi:MAG: hypothetical protein HRU17_17735 [Polyangiaceae bacterium]|nr:hypothetical protein [Polyangiaceae bacterium]
MGHVRWRQGLAVVAFGITGNSCQSRVVADSPEEYLSEPPAQIGQDPSHTCTGTDPAGGSVHRSRDRTSVAPPTTSTLPAPKEQPVASSALPAGLTVGRATELAISNDLPILVVHGEAGTTAAMIYLHGVCGNIFALSNWASTASHFVTILALRGDIPCDSGGRRRFSQSTWRLNARIESALATVRELRGGQLELKHPVIFGYSQGAVRAQSLALDYPKKYRRIVLGGAPRKPWLHKLRSTSQVAVFGGENEETLHMKTGVNELNANGVSSRYWELPDAGHGQYGMGGPRVIGDIMTWLFTPEG